MILKKTLKIILICAGVMIAPVLLSPLPRFDVPLSTVVEANDGSLLGARIADDGQWRFPGVDEIPDKFSLALLTFEDRYFYLHPGINPVSVFRALILNIRAGEIVSGGSTITMQVARLSGNNILRTYPAKITEALSAIKLEIFSSKKNILKLYANNAPFGGNIVGLEAASWRYLGKPSSEMTWAEAAALAVLPNSPSLVFPGKNQERLKTRRDILLRKLFEKEYFDSLTLILSIDEPLPGVPLPLPAKAQHLTDHFFIQNKGEMIRTTIDPYIQERANEIIESHQKKLSGNLINNSACLIIKVETGEVLAYVGNSRTEKASENAGSVDIIRSPRSTGSILKPILYAALQQSGAILPNTLIPDIPSRFPGFTPKNFDQSFSGAVPASYALSQSLNIPAVKMLQQYTVERMMDLLKKTGFTSFTKTAGHYGLSLILGGGEASLWELTGVYASFSRVLNRYNTEKLYSSVDYHMPVLISGDKKEKMETGYSEPVISASSIWLTYEALRKVNRPEGESGWQFFSSSLDIAWKTGTSFGFRDAWAIGTTPEYVIGVWAGNADGEGRPGLTGITAAAPILFDLISLIEPSGWFPMPSDEMTTIRVCSESGYRAGIDCPETQEIMTCVSGLKSESCPYHKIIHLDKTGTKQVNADCLPVDEIKNEAWCILPPAMEYFYRLKHPDYKVLPPYATECLPDKSLPVMEFIYPTPGLKIFIPRDQSGNQTRIISEIVHRHPSKKIFWHIDEEFKGTTLRIHQLEIFANPGDHILTVVDEDGNSIRCSFSITGKENYQVID